MSLKESEIGGFACFNCHPPSAVVESFTCNFFGGSSKSLIVNNYNRITVYDANSMDALLQIPVLGWLVCARPIRLPGSGNVDAIFVLSEKGDYAILSYDGGARMEVDINSVTTIASGSIMDRIGRQSEKETLIAVDPLGRCITILFNQGFLTVIPLTLAGSNGLKAENPFVTRLEDLYVIEMTFLGVLNGGYRGGPKMSSLEEPMLALIHQKPDGSRAYKTYLINQRSKELVPVIDNVPTEKGANIIIPLWDSPWAGVLVIGERRVVYLGPTSAALESARVNFTEPTVITAYCKLCKTPSSLHFLLTDINGHLYQLILGIDNSLTASYRLELVFKGITSIASSISVLESKDRVFIGSRFDDSQIIKVSVNPNERQVVVLDSMTNIGPIVDFELADVDASGQNQMITCSGALRNGSLRIVRSGVGVEQMATIEIDGVNGIFPLKGSLSEDMHQKYVLLSFYDSSSLLYEENGDFEQKSSDAFILDEPTLHCLNLQDDLILQVTPTKVVVSNIKLNMPIRTWQNHTEFGRISQATSFNNFILIAYAGVNLVLLEFVNNDLIEISKKKMSNEIACLSICPFGENGICAVGFWNDISVSLLEIPSFQTICKASLGGHVIPRSIVFFSFDDGQLCLFVGMGDGKLISFKIDTGTSSKLCLAGKKTITIGNQPIDLKIFKPHVDSPADHIFAACDRPTVVYGVKGQIQYSNVNMKDVTVMAPFHSKTFENGMIFFSPNGELVIGSIDRVQKLHVKTFRTNDCPRRICYQAETSTFGVLSVISRFHRLGEMTTVQEDVSFLKIYDSQSMEFLGSYEFRKALDGKCITSIVYEGRSYFVIGTVLIKDDEEKPSHGEIYLFRLTSDRKLERLRVVEVKGAVNDVSMIDSDVLIACINNKVVLFKIKKEDGDSAPCLTTMYTHQGYLFALTCKVIRERNLILIGDLMKSVEVLEYDNVLKQLKTIGRDHQQQFVSVADFISDSHFIVFDWYHNFSILERKQQTAGAGSNPVHIFDAQRLDICAEYHVGDMVNTFRRGCLAVRNNNAQVVGAEESKVISSVFCYGCVSGGIGLLIALKPTAFKVLSALQVSLEKMLTFPCKWKHSSWRTFTSNRKIADSKGVVDGDMLEAFLGLEVEQSQMVIDDCIGILKKTDIDQGSISIASVTRWIEELISLC